MGEALSFVTDAPSARPGRYTAEITALNGEPAILICGGHAPAVITFEFDGQRITRLCLINNPEKLKRVRL